MQATDADRHLTATVSPGDGDTVGVGMPVVVVFNTDVAPAQRSAVQARLAVAASPALDGSWHWVNGHEVHWRPQAYWPAHTQVTVQTDLTRLELGGGLWGRGQHTARFIVGDAHISTARVRMMKSLARAGRPLDVPARSRMQEGIPRERLECGFGWQVEAKRSTFTPRFSHVRTALPLFLRRR